MRDSLVNKTAILKEKILALHGPILILGGCSFLGANLFKLLIQHRNDIHVFVLDENNWRLKQSYACDLKIFQIFSEEVFKKFIHGINPGSIFDCFNYEYNSEGDSEKAIYDLNFFPSFKSLSSMVDNQFKCYIHAGSNRKKCSLTTNNLKEPSITNYFLNAQDAINVVISNYGRSLGIPAINILFPDIYGPLQDLDNPAFENTVNAKSDQDNPNEKPNILFVDDAIDLLLTAALKIKEFKSGSSIEINADAHKNHEFTDWKPITPVEEGIKITSDWQKFYLAKINHSNNNAVLDTTYSVSAIIACYKDGQAIPIMYQRLKDVFSKLNIEHEIIFVNDCSPDDSESTIREISSRDTKVIGISHSRNFGSQAAFKSGMSISSMNSCVLLDGDLQDTPELIEKFVEKWREGYDVVYGRRVKREATWFMQIAYKAFYRIFDYLSYVPIPKDAGDFSLISKRVVMEMLKFPERDAFLRGIRAFVGFKQTGVDYIRPERMFGVTTNSFFKNIGWAKKGILSFSNKPLNILSFLGITLFPMSICLGFLQVLSKLFFPDLAPPGFTSTISIIIFFGAINLFAISLIGEYLAKIFEEVKQRPAFIQNKIIKNGSIKNF